MSMKPDEERDEKALAWQVGVWDRISEVYLREIDKRFVPVVDRVIRRAALEPGHNVLDIGTGTGAVALQAALIVGAAGQVVGADPSPDMLDLARQRAAGLNHPNLKFQPGSA